MESRTKKLLILSGLAGAILAVLPAKTIMNGQFANKSLPRGLRNNNPGNLRITNNTWFGKVKNPLDREFESFDTMQNGLRAAIRNAHTQWNKGKDTITELIHVWAPPSENNTKAYVAAVAKAAGISPSAPIKWGNNDTTAKILYAIFCHENGALTPKYIKLSDVQAQLAKMWPNA